mmetsp:Transcript_20508/g.53857  ORF Transcript_20508/g.53857 Transcript_20508/m.53857 type:complete len:255 (+) Transcript_20508:29-793(+)
MALRAMILCAFAAAAAAGPAGPTHTHGNGPWEWSGVYALPAGQYEWIFSKNARGVYGAPDVSMRVVLLRGGLMADVLTNMHTAAEALLQLNECTLLDGGGMLKADDKCFELRFNQSRPTTSWTVRTAIAGKLAIYTEHVPTEFNARLVSGAGVDVAPQSAMLHDTMHVEVADHAHEHTHDEVAGHEHEHEHEAPVATAALAVGSLALVVAVAALCVALRQRGSRGTPVVKDVAMQRAVSLGVGNVAASATQAQA